MSNWIKQIDKIPWQIIALSGLLGFLVLIRYIHIQMKQ